MSENELEIVWVYDEFTDTWEPLERFTPAEMSELIYAKEV